MLLLLTHTAHAIEATPRAPRPKALALAIRVAVLACISITRCTCMAHRSTVHYAIGRITLFEAAPKAPGIFRALGCNLRHTSNCIARAFLLNDLVVTCRAPPRHRRD